MRQVKRNFVKQPLIKLIYILCYQIADSNNRFVPLFRHFIEEADSKL